MPARSATASTPTSDQGEQVDLVVPGKIPAAYGRPARSRVDQEAAGPEPASRIERVPWSVLGPHFIEQWGERDGKMFPEHVELVGPTGSGKSYLQAVIVKERARRRGTPTIILVTKRRDKTIAGMGWPITDKMADLQKHAQVVFWLRTNKLGDEAIEYHKPRVKRLLDYVWANSVKQSSELVVIDEMMYVQEELGLKALLEHYLREARSHGISLILSKQRLQGATREMHAETAWKIGFQMFDEDDNDRLADLFGPRRAWRPVIQGLDNEKREFLIQRKFTNETYISWVDPAYIKRQKILEEAARRNSVRA